MYFMISAYTESRKLGKALTRISDKLESIEKKIKSLEIQKPYEGIVISLVDEEENYFKNIPSKDRIHYVDVGISPNLTFLPNDDKKFIAYIYEKMNLVIEKCKLEQLDKEKVKEELLAWKSSL